MRSCPWLPSPFESIPPESSSLLLCVLSPSCLPLPTDLAFQGTTIAFSPCLPRDQVLRVLAKDEKQLSLLRDLEGLKPQKVRIALGNTTVAALVTVRLGSLSGPLTLSTPKPS